jgi:hypothetical protein
MATGKPVAVNELIDVAWLNAGVISVFNTTVTGSVAATIDTGAVLPTSYAALLIDAQLRGDTAAVTTNLNLRFNNDSGTNYHHSNINTTGTTASLASAETYGAVSIIVGVIPANTANASAASSVLVLVPNYGGTTFHKTTVSLDGEISADAGPNQAVMHIAQGRWKNTAAINRVTLLPSAGNFQIGSRVTIWALGS